MASERAAILALDIHDDKLLENPNVAYVAVVEDNGDFVIEVGVYDLATEEKAREIQSEGDEDGVPFVPSELEVPGRFSDEIGEEDEFVSVSIVESGEIETHYKNRNRPAEGGDSIGNARRNSAGSLGAGVTISSRPGRLFVITNWHVLVGSSGKNGDRVLQPGRLDGGKNPADWVANLTWSALNSRVDLAIAEVRTTDSKYVLLGSTRCFGAISGSNYNVKVKQRVKKCGRTTNSTKGTVRSTNASIKVNGYPSGKRTFKNQLLFSSMSKKGDSGSLALDTDDRVVGLIFAGDGSKVTAANKISDVEAALSSSPLNIARVGSIPNLEFV